MDLRLTGKSALVLGASKGLGRAVAATLNAEGAHVTIAGRDPSALEEAARAMAHPDKVSLLRIDLSQPQSVADAIGELGERGSTAIDILVNNGGGPPPGSVLDVQAEQWLQYFSAMVASTFTLTNHLVPAMRARRWGRVVNIVSSGVVQPIPNLGISNALRASIVGYAKTLAAEVAGDGVTVNSVLPGRIETDRLKQLDAAAAERTGQDVEAVMKTSHAQIPMGRYGRPQEFASVVAFLASDLAGYVTGSSVRVDGGMIRSV
jgi:3-oxoacyl-[acyl-carrier protein] reductase